MNGSQEEPAWIITGVRPQMIQHNNQTEQGVIVTYRLPDGTQDTLQVPRSEYNPEHVFRLVHEAASEHLQMLQLQGKPLSQALSELPPSPGR